MSEYLIHYGVKGMHWGIRRYQNYDGTLKHPKGKNKNSKKKFKLTEGQKNAIKIGAMIAGAALLTYGAYKLSEIEYHNYNNVKAKMPEVTFTNKDALINAINNGSAGKTMDQIDKSLLRTINHGVNGITTSSPERSMNCGLCSTSYIMNSLFGVKCTAAEDYKIAYNADGFHQLLNGKTMNQLLSSFNNVKRTDYGANRTIYPRVNEVLDSIPKGTGILMVDNEIAAHFLNYEKSDSGIVLIDTQNNLIGDNAMNAFKNWYIREAADFSEASIKKNNVSMLQRLLMD